MGLADEIANNFPSWGPGLQASLVSAIVLSQFVGPPLLKCALSLSGEAGTGRRCPSLRAASDGACGSPPRGGGAGRVASAGRVGARGGGGDATDCAAVDDVTRVTERPTASLLRADRARATPAGRAAAVPDGGETSEDEASTVVVSFGLRDS